MDRLSVGLNSVSQRVLVRQLQLRQLKATLSKGQTFSLGVRSCPLSFLLIAEGLTVPLCVCRSVV